MTGVYQDSSTLPVTDVKVSNVAHLTRCMYLLEVYTYVHM